jgi:hypothetical protein
MTSNAQSALERDRILVGIGVFIIPLFLGLVLSLVAVDLFVPRDQDTIRQFAAKITGPSFGARAAAALYHLAVAATITTIACAVSIWFCGRSITSLLTGFTPAERRWTVFGVAVAIAVPLTLLVLQLTLSGDCSTYWGNWVGVDDCVAKELFNRTILAKYAPKPYFAVNHDWQFLTCVIFIAYLLAGSGAAAAASRVPATEADRARLLNILNVTLFLMAAVLVAAVITAKFRFDVGLATLDKMVGDKSNPAFAEYEALASGITTYWAAVGSLWLALIYLPGAYFLHRGDPATGGHDFLLVFTSNREIGLRFLKIAAIISPAVVGKLIETFATGG